MEAALSASEQAFFESGGETEIVETPAEVQNDTAPQEDLAAQPEITDEPEAVAPERDEKGKFVPHQALHAEREEHKKTKAQLDELGRRQAILDDRWNTMLKLREQQTPKQEEQQAPDPETDIFGYAKWQKEQFDALQAKLSDQERQSTERQQIESQEREIWSSWEQSATEYSAQKPEFKDAVSFLSETRTKQLQAFGKVDPRFSTPQGINDQINAELRAIVVQAKQANVSPAEFVHNLAVNYGFQAKAPDPATIGMPDKLAGIASAQEAARTVGQASGRSGSDALTPESIAAMPAAEFERWASDPKNAAILDKMLGA